MFRWNVFQHSVLVYLLEENSQFKENIHYETFFEKDKLEVSSGLLKSAKPVFGIFKPNVIFKCLKKVIAT